MAKPTKTTPKPKLTDKSSQDTSCDWLSSNLLWGGLLLLLGVLLLLGNLGLVAIDWSSIWKLWPVVVIIFGLSILSLKGRVAAVVYGIAAVVIIGLTWATLTGSLSDRNSGVTSDEFTISREHRDIERLEAVIDVGASSLDIAAHDGAEMVNGRIESRLADLKHDSSVDGNMQTVKLSQERNWQFLGSGSINDIDVRFSRQVPLRLEVDAGASSIDADMSDLMLESLKIDSGASSIKLRLGDKLAQSEVSIDTGVSTVTLQVPQTVGVKLNLDAGLSSRELPSDFEQTGDKTYQSADYDEAERTVTITIDMGVSSFKLVTY